MTGLVELHGGVISASSAGEGLGSTFSIRIPLRAAAPPSQVPSGEEGAAASLRAAARRDKKSSSSGEEIQRQESSGDKSRSRVSHRSRVSDLRSQNSDNSSAMRRGGWMLTRLRSFDRDEGQYEMLGADSSPAMRRPSWASNNASLFSWLSPEERPSHHLTQVQLDSSEVKSDTRSRPDEVRSVGSGTGGGGRRERFEGGTNGRLPPILSRIESRVDIESDLGDFFEPPASTGTGALNIMIVDDSGPSRKSLGRLLSKEGHMIVECANGKQAVQALKTTMALAIMEDQLDIIILDDIMPVMGGPEAAKCLRELGYQGTIVGLTG